MTASSPPGSSPLGLSPGGAFSSAHLSGKASLLNMIDYYNLLKIPPEASQAQIKTAFRRLAKQVHPDANPGSTEEEREVLRRRFIQLAQAYDVLSNPDRRERYRRQWRAHRRQPPGESGRSARSGGAGSFRSSSAAFGGARHARAGNSQHRKREEGNPGFDFPDDLLDDVKNLLAGFGLDLKQPLEMLLERLTAWAREIFQGVIGGMEQGAAGETPRAKPRGGKKAGTKGREQESPASETRGGKTGTAAKQTLDGAETELEAELAALKKTMRKGNARSPSGEQEIEEELGGLKAIAASRKTGRE